MTEEQMKEEIDTDPFHPVRLHLVSGKTLDLLRADAAMPLRDRMLVFINLAKEGRGAETYNIVSYQNIERIERLDLGHRANGRRSKGKR